MGRDIAPDERIELETERSYTDRKGPDRENKEPRSRAPQAIQERGYTYQISPAELDTMREIGRFRTIAIEDLRRTLYRGDASQMREELRSLRDQGLLQLKAARTRNGREKLPVVVLTKIGKTIVARERADDSGQKFYAGFVKPGEVAHDAAIYRMYQAEAAKIERAGGKIRRVVLDYELKHKIYSVLAKARALPPAEYAKKQAEVAKENGLIVVKGKIPLPDLRIEYETREGEQARVNLEVATQHYHGGALAAKAEAGFKMYAVDGSGGHLSKVLDDHDIVAEILSL
jgi:hypothetical protein